MFNSKNMGEVRGKRRRVLLVAYACSPFRGSEQGIGWHRVIEIAKYHDTWVICKKETYEDDIRRYFSLNGEIPGLYFYFVPRTRFEGFLRKIPVPYIWYLCYNLWQRRAGQIATELHKKINFDLCHQVNLTGFREPGYLWKLNIPFIWGPVGGTENASWQLVKLAGFRGAITESMRNLINNLQLNYSPRVRKATKKASIILAGNSDAEDKFRRVHNINPILLPQNGIPAVVTGTDKQGAKQSSIKILWSSRLSHNKCLPLLLRALAKMPTNYGYELRILGDGPQRKQWRNICGRLGIEQHCHWMGFLPYDQAKKQFEWADIFVFTSLRDTMATVVLEALSYGVPVICLDHSGSRDVINNDCGVKIPVNAPDEIILRLCSAIISVSDDRTKLESLSRGAIERARKYLWSNNGKQLAKLYQDVLASPRDDKNFAHVQ